MKNRIGLILTSLFVVTLLGCFPLCASAEELPDGAVGGLPERLVVLDDEGHSVSDNGEYFFRVEDMQPLVTYTKNIQLMNLREDKSYRIYFRAEPLSRSGEIDLENDCECVVAIDGKTVYSGKITGEGTPDIREQALDMGYYAPGDSHNMTVSVTWNGTSAGDFIDYGKRIVTVSGVEVVREKSGDEYIHGETEFKWIFYAMVTKMDEKTYEIPSKPYPDGNSVVPGVSQTVPDVSYQPHRNDISDFVQTGEAAVIAIFAMMMAAAMILIFLIIRKKKKQY